MSYHPPCSHCGRSDVPSQASFCPACGAKLRSRTAWPAVALALLVFACGFGLYQYSTAPEPATVQPKAFISTQSAATATPLLSLPQARTTATPATSKPAHPAPPVIDEVEVDPETASESDEEETTVYVTRTGKKYHRAGCRYLSRSMIPISLEDAQAGYDPCSVCDPPE